MKRYKFMGQMSLYWGHEGRLRYGNMGWFIHVCVPPSGASLTAEEKDTLINYAKARYGL